MTLSHEDFIVRSQKVWGDRWDYSKTVYRAMRFKVTLICKVHGEFTHGPQPHLKGLVGCGPCNGQTPITTEEFIERVKGKHGSDRYDFSEVRLSKGGIHQKVILTCLKHSIKFSVSGWAFLR